MHVLADVIGKDVGPFVLLLLGPHEPAELQRAAARAVGDIGDAALARKALDSWPTYTTATRRDLLAAMLRVPVLTGVLIDALERGTLAAGDFDPAARDLLRRIPNADLKPRAQKILEKSQPADRASVLAKYQESLRLAGDVDRGAKVFAQHCATCHHMHGQGQRVGPDLSGIASRPPSALLEDILDPSKEVAPDHLMFLAVTKKGQVLTGLLASETANAVTLRRADAVDDAILRSELQELRGTGRSLMPEGFEQVISIPEMADLLRYLHAPPPTK